MSKANQIKQALSRKGFYWLTKATHAAPIANRRYRRYLAALSVLVIIGIAGAGVDQSSPAGTCTEPSVCGQNSGLVPFHKDAVAASLVWEDEGECPKMLIWMRPSEYSPKDYLSPTVGGVFSGFNQKYLELVQGFFPLTFLDRSGWSRYSPDLDRENTQVIDVCKLQALIDTGLFNKTSIAALTDADMSLTDPFFENAGFSKGLAYNVFCMGAVSGADSRIYVFGIHDKGGNNGGRKVNIFDSLVEEWIPRPIPCVRDEFGADPTGTEFAHCNPRNEDNTDPPAPSDMRYQRWYPTAVTLPDGRILILSGSDQDTSVGPDLAPATKVRQAVPEVYDPETDRSIALENARKVLPMFPRSFVVQTGPEEKDWRVCVTGEAAFIPSDMRHYDPFTYNGNTPCLDVLAALADPHLDTPAENHWELVATAKDAHDNGAGVMMVTINADGTWSEKVVALGGTNGFRTQPVATVEMIDYSDADLKWQQQSDLMQPTTENNVVALPDGKMLVVGGRNTFQYQMFDPENGSITSLIRSSIPRHDHSTALLMPNGGVWIMGGNRTQLIPGGDENASVPVLEFYKPPYFFKGPRPVIDEAPNRIQYGESFKLEASGGSGEIGAVVIIRTGPITHNWAWGNQYVKLPFAEEEDGSLVVTAPPLPGLAVPGDYLLFVVSEGGVPSIGKHVRLT